MSPMVNYPKPMLSRKTWKEFRDIGLLWWVNRMLHLFGWVLVMEFDSDMNITSVFPARTSSRGFETKDEMDGFEKLSRFLEENAEEISSEAQASSRSKH